MSISSFTQVFTNGGWIKYRRIALLGLATYALSFLIGVIVGLALGFNYEAQDFTRLPDSLWFIGMTSTAMLTYFMTTWYFRGGLVAPSAGEGLLFGIGITMTGLVLDAVLFIPQILKLGVAQLLAYYTHPYFFVTLLILLAVATSVGIMGEKKE